MVLMNKSRFQRASISIVMICIVVGFVMNGMQRQVNVSEYWNLFKSAASFHISLRYNEWKYGSSFTFHQLAGDVPLCAQSKRLVHIERDKSGNIVAVNDGRKTPLILSSIPRTAQDIQNIRSLFGLAGYKKIGLFTLNRFFEQQWSGLRALIENDKNIRQFQYPTTDFQGPHFIDILRAVRDIKNRDSKGIDLAAVHCKAGRGRSAVIVGAYILYICSEQGVLVTVGQVEHYLRSRRPQVRLNKSARQALEQFKEMLIENGGFENLYNKFEIQMQGRDQELE